MLKFNKLVMLTNNLFLRIVDIIKNVKPTERPLAIFNSQSFKQPTVRKSPKIIKLTIWLITLALNAFKLTHN